MANRRTFRDHRIEIKTFLPPFRCGMQEADLATVQPYHSSRLGSPKVHHDQGECWDGNNIEAYYFKHGTGGYPLCQTCQRIKTANLARYIAARRRRP